MSAINSKKVFYKVSSCKKTVSDNVIKHSLAYLSLQKWLVVDVSF